ncbi:MAG: RNA polymerase sigma-70 factor [Bacteroidales bacterium]|nr:RNA polymerase sigma-70 factor [Bacteroidales bacterium]
MSVSEIHNESNRLFHKVKRGDSAAFEKLYKRLYPRLDDYATKILKDKVVAQDILQEIFIKLWRKRNEIAPINIEAFLFRILKNQCLTHLKNMKVFENTKMNVKHSKEIQELYRIDFLKDEPVLLIEKELELQVEAIIETLPDKCREVFLLSRVNGMRNREIADKLGINIKNVERHISRALKSFRAHFGNKIPIIVIGIILTNIYS